MSIASRVTVTCTALLLLSLLLLFQGLRVGEEVQAANERIGLLTHLLRAQNEEDSALRRLRLDLGEATRDAERRQPVSDARWARLTEELRDFETLSTPPASEAKIMIAADVRQALDATRNAARAFVPIGRQLVSVARRDPAGIKQEMEGFLDALRLLEVERTRAREALSKAIEQAVAANIEYTEENAVRLFIGELFAVLILFITAAWLRLRVIAPIIAIAKQLRGFNRDEPHPAAVPGLHRTDEIGDLARGLSEYRQAVEERRVAQRRIDFLAHHDALTGLPNRLLFENRLAHELARSRRTGAQLAVFAIDMDGFKEINDRHGHAGGDGALKRAGDLLASCSRADDLVARIGGDEFAIIQAAGQQPMAAEAMLSRLSAAIARTMDDPVPVRMSIGVAIAAPGQDADDLYNSADVALYRAKSDGRNKARFFDTGLQEEIRLRRRLGRDLESAIATGALYILYQPIATRRQLVVGYEALLRWRHPDLGEISPSQFIPIAESTGQIGEIGLWMAERAMATAAGWPDDICLSLNLSPLQFREPDLGRKLLEAARRHGMAPERLEFEVTESATLLGHHREAVLQTLRLLQDAGATIAMDDFGTGHSSLSNLKDFRFNKLKIDRSFIAAMLVDQSSASIIRATIGLGRSLGALVVAEGVETQAQFDQLCGWGCDRVQGYFIGRPAPTILPHVAPPKKRSQRRKATADGAATGG